MPQGLQARDDGRIWRLGVLKYCAIFDGRARRKRAMNAPALQFRHRRYAGGRWVRHRSRFHHLVAGDRGPAAPSGLS